jgi:PD-(D/E)XK nuclease superfamily
MTTPPVQISNSEIQTFKECRRKWWLAYYRRLKQVEYDLTGPLAFGSRFHDALDKHYSTGEQLLDVWETLVLEDITKQIALGRDTVELEHEAELGRIMLEGYLQWNEDDGIDADLEIVSTEQRLITPLMGGRVELMAKLDMRVKRMSDGVRLFRDWKTAASFSDFIRTGHMNEQMLTYMLIEGTQVDEDQRCEGGLFTLFKKVKRTAAAKPPFYQQIEVRHNQFTLRSFWSRLHGVLADMLAVRDALDNGGDPSFVAYPTPSRNCSWKCQFFAVCPLFDDGSAVEAAVGTLFTVGDPYDYYGHDEVKGAE